MKNFETQYKILLEETLNSGLLRPTRSGVNAYSLLGKSIEHDMELGFPLLTGREMPKKSMMVETEFYLKGYTDKNWLQERGCHFWDHWTSKIPKSENDLGPTYGFEWRHWNAKYDGIRDYSGEGVDQIAWVIDQLKNNPESKRLVVSQWNASDIENQAIPPCPFAFQLLKYGNKLNLVFYQRSADICLGLPNDFAQHALLLHLFCKETGLIPGTVVSMFGQIELFETHLTGAKELLSRETFPFPRIETNNFNGTLNWTYEDTNFVDYKHGDKIPFPIAI
jgi:thymidylate synthase